MIDKYHFEEQHLILAYQNERPVGVFITYSGESFTKDELLDYFEEAAPTHLVAKPMPAQYGKAETMEDLLKIQEEIAANIEDVEQSEDAIIIPKTLH